MVDRVLRFIGPVAMVLLMLRFVSAATLPLTDPDFWWHIRLGRMVLANGVADTVANWAPSATADWTPTQLLPEVLAAGLYDRWGLPAIAWLYGVGLVAFVLVAYSVCRRGAGSLPAALATGLCVMASSGSLSPRPQVLSFIFLLVVVAAWLRTEQDLKPRWWLIPLTWLWALCHGSWITSALVGAAVVIGLALGRRLTRRELVRLASVPVLCVAIVGVTPIGPDLLLGPLIVNERTEYIAEWQRTSLLGPAPWAVILMVVVTLVAGAKARRADPASPVPLGSLLLLLQAVGWLFLAERTVAIAACIVAPLFATAVSGLLQRARGSDEAMSVPRAESLLLGVGALVSIVALTVAVPHTTRAGAVPTEFGQALEALPHGTVVLNDDKLGGWLLLRHPNTAPVVDGLFDAYSLDHLRSYRRIVGLAPGWERDLRSTGATWAVLPEDSAVCEALIDASWEVVDRDRGFALLRAPA